MIWLVIWVVFMIFWLLGAGFVSYDGGVFNGRNFLGYSFIPWVCVLILGLVVFNAFGGGPAPAPVYENPPVYRR